MGKQRARTEEELAARRNEILKAAGDLLMTCDYNDVTLATIAEKISISRPSLYNYYETRELVLADLMIREYEEWEKAIRDQLAVRLSREEFCRTMTDILWERETLLKLLSLQLSVWGNNFSEDVIVDFQKKVKPFYDALREIVQLQFPNATEKAVDRFRIQFTLYCNSLYALDNLPQCQMQAFEELDLFGEIPTSEQLTYEGLLLLTSDLQA